MSAIPNDLTTREFCGLCGRVNAVGFWVPDDVWAAVVHHSRLQDIHCLYCFITRADEKHIAWDRDIKFYPVSYASHHADRRQVAFSAGLGANPTATTEEEP